MKDLDLVAMRSAAERFQSVASDESTSVSEYVHSYNAYTEAVGVDAVLALIQRAQEGESFDARFNAWLAECPGNR